MKTCPVCEKGTLTRQNVPYSVHGVELGKFLSEVCNNCHESWFSEETARKIEGIEKKKGLFGLVKHSKIGYSGNSLIIRIPKDIAKFMDLKKEKAISIYPEDKNRLLIEL